MSDEERHEAEAMTSSLETTGDIGGVTVRMDITNFAEPRRKKPSSDRPAGHDGARYIGCISSDDMQKLLAGDPATIRKHAALLDTLKKLSGGKFDLAKLAEALRAWRRGRRGGRQEEDEEEDEN